MCEFYLPLSAKYYKAPYNVFRRAKLILFTKALGSHEEFVELKEDKQFGLIEAIENSCYNYVLLKADEENIPVSWKKQLFRDLYSLTCAKISANIDANGSVKNTYLFPKILDGSIKIEDLPRMSSQEIFPEMYKDVIAKLERSKMVVETRHTTSIYTCRRCKKSECTVENRYNRSLDEGVNLRVTCMNCAFAWNA